MCFYPVLCARPCSRVFVAAFGLQRMPHCCWLPRCLRWLLACIVLRVNLVMLLWAHVTVYWLPRTGGWSSWLFPMLALRLSAGVADHFQLQVTIVTVVIQVVESHDVVLCISPSCWFRILNLGKWKTLKRKPQYGNRNTEVRWKATYGSRMCLIGKGWLSPSEVRAKYWYIGLQQALKQSFSMTRLRAVLSWTRSETTVSIC